MILKLCKGLTCRNGIMLMWQSPITLLQQADYDTMKKKSEERAPMPAHSPRVPHKHKTLPHQSSGGMSPPHPKQRWDQQRKHRGGIHQRKKIRYTPHIDQQNH